MTEQELFKNCPKTGFQSIWVQEMSLKVTDTTKKFGKHTPTSVIISSNLVGQQMFFCNSDAHHLVASIVASLENLASQSKTILEILDPRYRNNYKKKLDENLGSLLQRHN